MTGTASELNDLLAAGELDVSVVSAVEYARNAAAYQLLPDLAITCDGPVHSVVLFSRRPIERARRRARCCSQRVVAHLGAAARAALPPPLEDRLPGSRPCGPRRRDLDDARRRCRTRRVLVIGDAALVLAADGRAIPITRRPGRRVEGLDRAAVRVRRLGGAARRADAARGSGGPRELLESRDWGLGTSRRARATQAARGTGVAEPVCREYLGDLDYALSYRHLAGLTDFFRRLAQDGLVPDGSLSFISAA